VTNSIRLFLVTTGMAGAAAVQTEPTKPLTFEVASVRPNKSQDASGARIEFLPGGRFTAINAPLWFIVLAAYNLPFRSNRLTGGPDWIRSERYDIDAKAEKDAIPSGLPAKAREARMRPMLQALLADRFKMTVRGEIKERPAYVLAVAKNGPKLQKSKREEKDCPELEPKNRVELELSCHFPSGGQGNGIHARAVDMSDVVQIVESFSGRPFVDHTGLKGLFDIDTEGWVPLIPRPGPPPGTEPSAEDIAMADPARPTLFIIFDRLGLKMESQNAPVATFVIDHAERPTEN
jgi:uncharacterized protein (TIGR03435 family)